MVLDEFARTRREHASIPEHASRMVNGRCQWRSLPDVGHGLFVAEAVPAFTPLAADMVLRTADGAPLLPRLLDGLLGLRRCRGARCAKS